MSEIRTALRVVEDMKKRLEMLDGKTPDQVYDDYSLAMELNALLKNDKFCAMLGTIELTRTGAGHHGITPSKVATKGTAAKTG